MLEHLPVAVIGAGPVGLAAAAHVLERGLEPVILEAGPSVGTAVRAWGHVAIFSPWRFSIDRSAVALLRRHGWTAPDPDGYPTGHEIAAEYLEHLAAVPEIAPRLRLGRRVTGIGRSGLGKIKTAGRGTAPFELRTRDAAGQEQRLFARAVIDASGTWDQPNPAGSSGLPAFGEREAAERIRYGMPDILGRERGRYAGRRVVVLGGGHSATGTLIDLVALRESDAATRIVWANRRQDLSRSFGGGEADQLPERGRLGSRLRALVQAGAIEVVAPFATDALDLLPDGSLRIGGESDFGPLALAADELVVATGFRPDLGMLAELRLDLDPAIECPRVLAPLIDPNVHSCGTVRPHGAAELAQPEPDFYVVGMKSYGRAPTFLLATGYEQVRSVAAALAGDLEAAGRVELVLPETGVCSGPSNRAKDSGHDAPASETPAVRKVAACCGAA